ncbi:AAA family ATPase [Methylobacterium sp. HMF5984]|uniref:AAA family ATPase n=1 Tax=Methylobacterium sp. HMF5984 TaxID=3367370 RepID=UPI003852626A
MSNGSKPHGGTEEAFRRWYDLGYTRLLPVVPPSAGIHNAGKRPGLFDGERWIGRGVQTFEATEPDLTTWGAMSAGVGLRMGKGIVTLDIDVLSEAWSVKIADAAVRALGTAPVRIGRWPKQLLMYRAPEDVPYMSVRFADGVSKKPALIELLAGSHNYANVDTIHPQTGKPYTWPEGIPRRDELPFVTTEQLETFFAAMKRNLPSAQGSISTPEDRGGVDQQALRGDPELIKAAMAAIPNRHELFGYEKWRDIATALRAALPDDQDLGEELFVEFSDRTDLAPDEVSENPGRIYRSLKPPFKLGKQLIYDLAEKHGGWQGHKEALFDAAAAAAQPDEPPGISGQLVPAPTGPNVFKMLSLGEIVSRPPLRFVVAGYLPEQSVGFLYGEPGSRKSFIALDWALHLAFGKVDWHGSAIDADPTACVVYLAGEGAHGFRTRVLAWAKHHGIPESEIEGGRFRLITENVDMMNAAEVEKLARSIRLGVGRTCFVVVDTVSRAIPGADENLQKEMSAFVSRCEAIRDVFECVVLGVHHANQKGMMRGSGVLKGNGDFVFKLTKGKDSNVGDVLCEKQKDGPDGWTHSYRFETVQVTGGSSLVPSGRVTSTPRVTVTAPDETARVLGAMDAAWVAKDAWRETFRGGERHAVKRIVSDFGFTREGAETALKDWVDTGRIELSVFDKRNSRTGYRVVTYELPPEDIFS